jgi:glutamine synthetase
MAKKPKTPALRPAPLANVAEAKSWASAQGVTEIECLVPDLAGVARGKIMPSDKFFDDTAMALPSSIFLQTITGE